jgi:hypothetical protein
LNGARAGDVGAGEAAALGKTAVVGSVEWGGWKGFPKNELNGVSPKQHDATTICQRKRGIKREVLWAESWGDTILHNGVLKYNKYYWHFKSHVLLRHQEDIM